MTRYNIVIQWECNIANSKPQPQQIELITILARGIREGTVQSKATVSFTTDTGDDSDIANFPFWDYVDERFENQLADIQPADARALARAGFLTQLGSRFRINAHKITSFKPKSCNIT